MEETKMGRPTKYRDEYADELIEFFSLENPSYREHVFSNHIQLIPRLIPTFQRFAFKAGVASSTLWTWANARDPDTDELLHPDFHDAYTRAKDCQAAMMIEAGIVGALNPSFAGLLMKNLHDWKDKIEQESTHSEVKFDIKAIDEALRKAAEEKAEKMKQMEADGTAGKFQ